MTKAFILALVFSCTALFGQATWTSRTSGTTATLRAAVWADSQFVVVGDNGVIRTSTDGVVWVSRVSGTTNHLRAIAWSGNGLVAVGEFTQIFSADGITWIPNSPSLGSDMSAVIWSRSKEFVALYPQGAVRSTTGLDWPAYGLGFPVAGDYYAFAEKTPIGSLMVGKSGAFAFSQDNAGSGNWHLTSAIGHPLPTKAHMNAIVWSGSKAIIVGDSGHIIAGNTNTYFERRDSKTPARLNAVVWTGTQYLVVGDSGKVRTSLNDSVWTTRNSGTTAFLYGAAASGTQFVAVGRAGTIITSPYPAILAPTLMSSVNTTEGLPSVTFSWAHTTSGQSSYTLQVSTTYDFSSPVVSDTMATLSSPRAVSGLAPVTKHYWRVGANYPGVTQWSRIASFTTAASVAIAPMAPSSTGRLSRDRLSLRFELTQRSHVSIRLIDSQGKVLRHVESGYRDQGVHLISVPQESGTIASFLDVDLGDYREVMRW